MLMLCGYKKLVNALMIIANSAKVLFAESSFGAKIWKQSIKSRRGSGVLDHSIQKIFLENQRLG